MIDDLKGDESWRMFRIISEFTEGFEELSELGFAITLFGSARTQPDDLYYRKADGGNTCRSTQHRHKHFGAETKEEWLECLEKLCEPNSPFLRK